MTEPQDRSRVRVARNFIKTYGRSALREFILACEAGESGQIIADQLGVSRERVRQWRNTFGTTVSFYQPHPEVKSILMEVK